MGGEGFFLAMGTAGRKKDHNDAQEQREKFHLFLASPNRILLHRERGQQQLVTRVPKALKVFSHTLLLTSRNVNKLVEYVLVQVAAHSKQEVSVMLQYTVFPLDFPPPLPPRGAKWLQLGLVQYIAESKGRKDAISDD